MVLMPKGCEDRKVVLLEQSVVLMPKGCEDRIVMLLE